jgi:hypothetical protein
MSEVERKKIYLCGNVLLNIVKWIFLIITVLMFGFTIGLIVSTVIYGTNLPLELLTKFTYVLLPYNNIDVQIFVNNYGMEKVLIASIGYGVAYSLYRLLFYILIVKSMKLFKNVTIGEIFNKGSLDLITEMVSLSFMVSFIMPVMLEIITLSTHLFEDAFFNVGFAGLFFLVFTVVMRIVIERGIQVQRQNNKYDRSIDDYKADIDELKIQSIKREAELKKLKAMVEEANAKPVKKATTTKTEEAPKKRKHNHSRAKKSGTTEK